MSSREHSLRARIATEYRRRDPDPAVIAELQRERAVVRIRDYAERVLAAAPPLTIDQRRELAAILLDEGGASAAA